MKDLNKIYRDVQNIILRRRLSDMSPVKRFLFKWIIKQ